MDQDMGGAGGRGREQKGGEGSIRGLGGRTEHVQYIQGGEKGGMEGEEPLTLAMIAPEGIGSSAGGPPIHGQTEEKDSPTTFGHFGESMPCTDGYLVNFFHAEERKKAPGEQADIGREKAGPWTDYPSRPSSSSSSSDTEGEKRGRSEEKKWGRGTQLEKKRDKKPTATMLEKRNPSLPFCFPLQLFFFEKSFPHFPLPGNGRA